MISNALKVTSITIITAANIIVTTNNQPTLRLAEKGAWEDVLQLLEERQARSSHNMPYSGRNTVLFANRCLPTFHRQIGLYSVHPLSRSVGRRHVLLINTLIHKKSGSDQHLPAAKERGGGGGGRTALDPSSQVTSDHHHNCITSSYQCLNRSLFKHSRREKNFFLSILGFETRTRIQIRTILARIFENNFFLVYGLIFSMTKKLFDSQMFQQKVCIFLRN